MTNRRDWGGGLHNNEGRSLDDCRLALNTSAVHAVAFGQVDGRAVLASAAGTYIQVEDLQPAVGA